MAPYVYWAISIDPTALLRQQYRLMRRRAVVTGLGIVAPIGTGVEKFWRAACSGQSGIGCVSLFDCSKLAPECSIAAEVSDFVAEDWMSGRISKRVGRFTQFAVAGAKMALADARLDLGQIRSDRIHISIGTAMNGLADVAEPNYLAFLEGAPVSQWCALEYPAHSATNHVATLAGAHGSTNTVATACAAGLDAIAWAAEQVERDAATLVLAGGTESPLSPYTLTAIHSAGVLSKWSGAPARASRPFDKLRDGLVVGEGAAVIVVEEEEHARARAARIYASILGFASLSEGGHLRRVDETGDSDGRVMIRALRQADRSPQDIDYVSAHGNSMVDYDAAETAGIKKAFGSHAWSIPVSSIKSMLGQAFAASGAMQVVAACLSLRDGIVPPTINYDVRDPACDLDYVPNVARHVRVRTTLVHAHSMGGSHSALVLGRPT